MSKKSHSTINKSYMDKNCNKKTSTCFLYFLIFLTLSFYPFILNAQNQELDELKHKVTTSSNTNDSVHAMCEVVFKSYSVDMAQAYKYADMALDASKRLMDSVTVSRAFYAKAVVFLIDKRFDEAEKLFRISLGIAERANNPWLISWISNNLAECLIKMGKVIEAEYYVSIAYRNFILNNDPDMAFQSWWLLIYEGKQNYKDSLIVSMKEYLNKEERIDRQIKYLLELSYIYTKKEFRKEAMSCLQDAMELAEEVNDLYSLYEAYYQIANYLKDYQHNYPAAITYYNKILEISKNDTTINRFGEVFIDLGETYRLQGNDSLSLKYINMGLDKAKNVKFKHVMSTAYMKLGDLNYHQQNFDNAKEYYLKCFKTGCDRCPEISFHESLIKLGDTYLHNNNFSEAHNWYLKSKLLADSASDNYALINSYQALGRLYEKQNNENGAESFYLKSFNKSVQLNYLEGQQHSSENLSRLYDKYKNYQMAFYYLNKSKILEDSIQQISQADNIAQLEARFDIQNLEIQKKLEQNKAKDEIARQKQIRNFSIIGFCIAALFGLVIFLSYRRKIKDNQLLKTQKQEIEDISQKAYIADQKRLNFFSNISHELKTPLTLILGPIEKLICKVSNSSEDYVLLNMVQKNAHGLHYLINQLLDIRKLDKGNVQFSPKRGNITQYCKGIYNSFIQLAENNSISYQFNFDDVNIVCNFDHDIIEKALNNLLSNAFKHTPEKGEISVYVKKNKINSVVIKVSDNGTGIPEDQLNYVFDRYYQVENTNTGFNTGTGIGLAYTKELINLHSGEIYVQSIPGKGSLFTIELPMTEPEIADVSLINEAIPSNENNYLIRPEFISKIEEVDCIKQIELARNKVKKDNSILLIVEDNSDLRAFIKNVFENDFIVLEAADGQCGLKLANEFLPDVIISDVMMPEMDGLKMCQKLKENSKTNHIPVLLLTAKTGDKNELEGLKKGADDYLGKPFNSEILLARIKSLLEQKRILREHFQREFIMNPKEIILTNPDDKLIANAVKLIEENIMNPDLNVEMLMKELSISRTQLFRKIKAITNNSVTQFIRNIKLKRAAQLLKLNSLNLSEVMYQSGFNNRTYFNKCFSELYGCLPKDYAAKVSDKEFPKN